MTRGFRRAGSVSARRKKFIFRRRSLVYESIFEIEKPLIGADFAPPKRKQSLQKPLQIKDILSFLELARALTKGVSGHSFPPHGQAQFPSGAGDLGAS